MMDYFIDSEQAYFSNNQLLKLIVIPFFAMKVFMILKRKSEYLRIKPMLEMMRELFMEIVFILMIIFNMQVLQKTLGL